MRFLSSKTKKKEKKKKERKKGKKITETIGERARGNVFIVPSSSCLLLPPFSRSSRRKRLLLVPLLRRVPSPPPPPPASGLPAHNARAGFFWPRVQKPRRACGFHRNGRVNCQLRGGERRRGREREKGRGRGCGWRSVAAASIRGPPRYRLAILRDKFTRREKRLGSRFTGTVRDERNSNGTRPFNTNASIHRLFPPRRAHTLAASPTI